MKDNKVSLLGVSIWAIGALFFLYEYFLRTFVGSLAHQVIPDLHLSAETFALLGSAYYVAYGLMQIPVGVLADKFGVKKLLLFATAVCAGATFFFSQAHGFGTALIARVLMGFGSSFAFICLLVISVTWFPRRLFGFFSGASQFIGTLGPLLAGGPLIAFIAMQHATWRLGLAEVGGVGIVLFILVLIFVKTKPRDGESVLLFISREEPLRKRMKQLFKNKQAWIIAAYSATNYVSMSLLGAIWGTEFLQTQGLSQGASASIISLSWLSYSIACPTLGGLSDSLRRRKPILIGTSMLGLCAASLIVFVPFGANFLAYAILFCALAVAASGQNLGFATIAEQVGQNLRASALGLNNAMIMLSASVLPPLASYFIEKTMKAHGHTQIQANDFVSGFTVMPILFGVAIILSLFFIKETYCKPQKDLLILSPKTNEL